MNGKRVFIACSGLGRVRRGFESFMDGCHRALSRCDGQEIYLYKGGGIPQERSYRLWNMQRSGLLARACGVPFSRSGYFSEQASFFLSMLPHLAFYRPSLVYVSDLVLANLLRFSKSLFGFRVLYCNGGPTSPSFLRRWDHIHQVSPEHVDEAVSAGVPRESQTLIPHALPIDEGFVGIGSRERETLRSALGLPRDRRIVLSVGALNTSRKRMDYLIREVALLPQPKPYLLLVGARERDSDSILSLGHELLPGGFGVRSVERAEMPAYYRAADVFALASVAEGFGLAYVEALSYGLPCLVHDYRTSRYVLGEHGMYGDLTKEGVLAGMLKELASASSCVEGAALRHTYAYETFSWDRLGPQYIDMFRRCACGEYPRGGGRAIG